MKILTYSPEFATHFKDLNLEWLEHYFHVEPHDEEVLGNPEKYIIEPGGNIFFVLENETVMATVALMKMEEGVFELTKMAVSPEARGKKIGQYLMQFTIKYAREQGWQKLVIYSNRKLENAIHIYRKFGFIEIPLEQNNPYGRGDIKMALQLS